jgi:hypothetical protein
VKSQARTPNFSPPQREENWQTHFLIFSIPTKMVASRRHMAPSKLYHGSAAFVWP